MKVFSILKNYLLVPFFGLVLFLSFFRTSAQSIHIAAGTIMSQYDYIGRDGSKSDYFKRGSGNYFRMGAEFKMLDTLKYLTTTSAKGFYFSNHRFLAGVLSRFSLETSIDNSQLNAVGDIRGVSFDYQTNYLGLNVGLAYNQVIYRGWAIKVQGKVQGLKIIQGNQELLGSYRDLTLDPDFNKFQIALGWDLSLSKQVNPGLAGFISFSKSKTINAPMEGASTLNFQNNLVSIGLRFNTLASIPFSK